jgi:hypothetical protein
MQNNFSAIQFDESELDHTIEDLNISSDLSIEGQRSLAAYSLIAFSMAMAIRDEGQYLIALGELGDMPEHDDELQFLSEFGRALALDLECELEGTSSEMPIFIRRANEFLNSVNAQCH